MTLYNRLPIVDAPPEIGIERRIGSESDFVIADVKASAPVQIAVEIVHHADANVQRRLETLFRHGYAGLFVFSETGDGSPERIERYLQRVGAAHIGRFDPRTLELQIGSLLRSETVDMISPTWERLPAYLA
jgi:hypothetical protein